MLDRLKIVYGAVQERALLAALSHVCLYQGRVQATNGRMSIDSALPELPDLNAIIPADRFLAAIEAAGADARVEEKDGRVVIAAGRFRARIPALTSGTFPRSEPDPPDWMLEAPLLPTVKRLRPFMADDATNAWATALLCTATTATVTNNVCLLSEPCSMLDGTGIKQVAIPGWALDEIIRLNREPEGFGVSESSITFYFGDVWLKTQLILSEWPVVKVAELLKSLPKKMPEVPEGLAQAVDMVMPFCKDPKFPVILMQEDGVATEEFDHQAEVRGLKLPTMRFNGTMLQLVLSKAERFAALGSERAGFTIGPARGVIMGLRG